MADKEVAAAEPPKKKVSFGIQEDDKKAKADQYRRIGATSVALILQVLAMCMGETVEQVNQGFDPKAAEINDVVQLLRVLDEAHQPKGETGKTEN